MLTILWIVLAGFFAAMVIFRDSITSLDGCSGIILFLMATILFAALLNIFTCVVLTRSGDYVISHDVILVENKIFLTESADTVKMKTEDGEKIQPIDNTEIRNVDKLQVEERIQFDKMIGPQWLVWTPAGRYNEYGNTYTLIIPMSQVEK
jgi:hypothetical protein